MIYIFDIDGTLTPSRNKMDKNFHDFFMEFVKIHRVWLISGSDHTKTIEQIGVDLWTNVEKAYQCSGNQLFQRGSLIRTSDWELPIATKWCLEKFLEQSKYPHRYGNHIETRPGMVNFSIVGRQCTQEQREEYFKWDNEHKERVEFTKELKERYLGLDAVVGGEISIDIYPNGKDKGQIIDDIDDNFTFFGDRLSPGGNDYPLKRASMVKQLKGNEFFNVKSWKDTRNLLTSIIQTNAGII
jgi:phosphomannomutase